MTRGTSAAKLESYLNRRKPRDVGNGNLKRITRLVKLINILHSGHGQNIAGLEKAYGVSRRTAFRDIDALREAGMAVEYNPECDRYQINKSAHAAPVSLTPEEAMALISLAVEVQRNRDFPNRSVLASAAMKLENGLPESLKNESRSLRNAINIQLAPPSMDSSIHQVYQSLVDARQARRVLSVVFRASEEEEFKTITLRVYFLNFCRHGWYAIGRSSEHRNVSAFAIAGIRSVKWLDERYAIPRSFSVSTYLRNAWLVSPAGEADRDVVVRFSAKVALRVAAYHWHRTQSMEFSADGSLTFRVTLSGLHEVVWWILGFGDQAEVIAPEELRREVFRRARNMTSLNANLSGPLASTATAG